MKLDKHLIKGFVGSLLAKNFDDATKIPWFHEEFWEACTSDHKYVAIAAPRGHAKSTSITLCYTLAAVLFRDRKYVILVSDTEGQSVLFLNQIRSELLDNEEMRRLFGIVGLEKDNERDIIVKMSDGHRFRITAKGSEQRVRGMLWKGQRPDLIVGDDLENDEIVLNPERRTKFRRWVYGALLPILSDRGVVRIVGTVLHLDSFLNRTLPDDASSFTDVGELKVTSSKPNQFWHSIKYMAHNSDYSEILWKARWTAEKFKKLRAKYVEEGMPDVYAQEYLNNPLDESRAYFKKHEFQEMEEQLAEAVVSGRKELNYYIGVDLAISEKSTADYSVFVVAGVDDSNKLYVVDVVRERMDSREIIETIFHLEKTYKPDYFAIERGAIQKAIGPFLTEEAFKRGVFPSVKEMQPTQDKMMRARSIQGRMRIRGVYFDKETEWFPAFEQELLQFNRGKHDDQVDAFAYVGLMLDDLTPARTQEEVWEDEWEAEREATSEMDEGRNATTGY